MKLNLFGHIQIYISRFNRFIKRIGVKLFNYNHKHKLIFSSANDFDAKTQLYLEKILFNSGKDIVYINNMFEPYNPGKYFNFLKIHI